MTDQEVQEIANRVLLDRLSALGLKSVKVTNGVDHLGEDAIFIDAIFVDVPRSGLGTAPSEAFRVLAEELVRHGEGRFPYAYARFEGDDRAEVDDRPLH